MGIPTLITISGIVRNTAGPVAGKLVFSTSTLVRDMTTADVMIPHDIVAVAGEDGAVSVQVPATNDPDFTPTGWTWEVRPHFAGWRTPFSVSIPYNAAGSAIELADLVEVPADGGSELYALAIHTHEQADITGLEAELDAKLPTEEPEIVDTTFVVRKGDNSAGLRFRSTGGAVDVDKSNGDVVVSNFAGAGADPFGGAQTGLQRWRANGNTFAGLTEFGDSVYGGQQYIDSRDGAAPLAALGGKAGAVAIIAGVSATPGAPTTGTWATSSIVIDSVGALHLCTAGGTPGTWT